MTAIFYFIGFLSTFTVNHSKSYALIEKNIYEKVLCSIPLFLADDNGLHLDVFHDIKVDVSMKMKQTKGNHRKSTTDNEDVTVDVKVENNVQDGWKLMFIPPQSGTASLSVKIEDKHIRFNHQFC